MVNHCKEFLFFRFIAIERNSRVKEVNLSTNATYKWSPALPQEIHGISAGADFNAPNHHTVCKWPGFRTLALILALVLVTSVASALPPTIDSITPPAGAIAGGTQVNITGTAFTGATLVRFGGINATSFSIENDTAIIARTPAHAAGLVYVNVTTPEGTGAGAGKFTYVLLPTVTSVAPPTGPIAGGTPVKIIGTNFTGATSVKFGGTDVTSFAVENITAISAITPAHAAGLVSVNVTTPNGTAAGASRFTYVALPSITSIAPATGPVNTNIPIVITGANLIGATNSESSLYNVSFGGIVLTNMTVVSATTIRGSIPPGTAGAVNVNITTANGTAVTGTNKFTFVNPPTFTGITPGTGSLAGDTPITITGTDLIGAKNSAVSIYNISIGGTVLTNMTVVSATKIIGSTRPGSAGLADISISTPNGSVSAADAFTYVESQTFTGITPVTGPIAGGTWVNITGTNLIGATVVKFGGTATTAIWVENSTAIMAKTPARAAGRVYVNVTTPNGTAAGPNAFTYVALPTITKISPPTGPIAGGNQVNITGTNFIGATAVTFGGTAATSFSVENITSVIATIPARAAGRVTVNVITPNGTATGTNIYTYVAPPSITSIVPATGPVSTEIPVTITGANLIGATSSESSLYNVSFGGIVLTNMTAVSATTIRGSIFSNTAGTVNVNITTPNGTAVTGTNKFTYVDPPTFTGITPATGSLSGNTPVTITGTNLIGVKNSATSLYNVSIGGTALTNMTVVSATRIIGSTLPGTAGPANIDITTPNGSVSIPDGFTYVEAQTFAGIIPQTGPIAGGTWVNITGTNLIGATAVTIGGIAATGMSVENSTAIMAKTPAHAAGLVYVNVTTPNGTAAGPNAFTYISLPTLITVAPPTGPIAGDTQVTITGTNFTGATAVTFGGTTAASFSVENITSVIATVPAHAAGAVTVNIITPNGTAVGTNKYTYIALPSITSIAPVTGPVTGDTPITITGANLIGATNSESSLYNVSIGNTVLTNMTVVSAATIIGSTPAGIAGPVNVNITTPNGTAVTGTYKFTYVNPPTFTSITPGTGSLSGNTPVTITGTNLIGVKNSAASLYNVSIGGSALTNMTVVSATKIIGSTRPGTAGTASVDITTPNGTASGIDVFTYVESQTVTNITPPTGPVAGGTWVNITGANLVGATAVTFGGTAATGISVENSTAIMAKTPAHAAGRVYVNVTTPNGTAAGPNAFTYISLPTIASVAPQTGPIAGGTPVNITGTNFTGATAVTFGGTAATSFSVENITSVIAIVPAHAAGAVSVNVTTPNGTAVGTSKYTYVSLPSITSIAPPTGPIDGGNWVNITGANLAGAQEVIFGGTSVSSFSVENSTLIRAMTPDHAAGLVNINITTPNGTSVTGTGKFTYVEQTAFAAITPAAGPVAGNTPITITGINLIGAKNSTASIYNVSIGGTVLTNMTVISATKIIGSTPAGTAGPAEVDITTPNGTASGTGVFTFRVSPTVENIAPKIGQNSGTIRIANLKGTGFYGTPAVNLTRTGQADIMASDVTVESPTKISCIFNLTGKAAGAWNVTVINPDGQKGSLIGGFTVVDSTLAPTVTTITPNTGRNTTTIWITNLTGTRFSDGATVNLTRTGQADIMATNVSVVSANQINCTVNLTGTAIGDWNIVVTNPNTQSGTLTGGFNITNGIILPVANFTGTPRTGGIPLTVQFNDTSIEAPTSWNWSFGDGTYSNNRNTTHTYTTVGRFSVSLTASNTWGSNTSLKPDYITASDIRSGFTANVTNGTVPFTVAFTDTSTGSPVSWYWSFGDGNYSSLQNPVYTFSRPQVFNTTLTVTTAAGLTNTSLRQITGYATQVVTTSAVNGTTSSTVNGNQTMVVNLTGIENTGGSVTNTNTTVTITGGNAFWTNTQLFANNVSLNATTGNYSVSNVTQVIMKSAPVTANLNESVGDVSVSLNVALREYIPDADVDITITEGATTETTNAFQLAASNASLSIRDIAYTIQLSNTENINTNLTRNSTRTSNAVVLNMSVNHSWVARFNNGMNNDGRDAISILRYPETGSPQVLTTRFLFYDPATNLDWVEADSPNGLSVFGITSVAAVTTPGSDPGYGSGSGTGSGSGSDSDSAVASSHAEVARADRANDIPAQQPVQERENTIEKLAPPEDMFQVLVPDMGNTEQNGSVSFTPAKRIGLIPVIAGTIGIIVIVGAFIYRARKQARKGNDDR
jgi:PKD repeat protein/uncharacterized protein YjbI with pentapeptide repeats